MKYVHPFPARMAPELVFEALDSMQRSSLKVLDPMMGSGTTLMHARMSGHRAYGTDSDPLALILASAATSSVEPALLVEEGARLLQLAEKEARKIGDRDAYPVGADDETRAFARFWFDVRSRRQLSALTRVLEQHDFHYETFLKCAISRMIITKQGGVSLAEDVSHSRPHRTRDRAPVAPFEMLPGAVTNVLRGAAFVGKKGLPEATVVRADCRSLPFKDGFFDSVITSPPYLNAIDYLRGHRLSLIWFGYKVCELRELRATNVGSTCGSRRDDFDALVSRVVCPRRLLDSRLRNMLRRYLFDLDAALMEIVRVLARGGTATFVIGDCEIRQTRVLNSLAVQELAISRGLSLAQEPKRRRLPDDKRYLPPARRNSVGITNRMRDEVILRFVK